MYDAKITHRSLRSSYLESNEANSRITLQVTVDPQEPTRPIPVFASPGEVSELFNLTEDQDTAFLVTGRAPLQPLADIKNGWFNSR